MTNMLPSTRAQIVERRTYLRPLNEDGTEFETSDDMRKRVIGHQRWLWERQIGRPLNDAENAELDELEQLIRESKVSMSGRVKWMGGTDIVKQRESAGFNCSFTNVNTPADMVDVLWLLLQGCGVGFRPVPGILTGFSPALKEIEVVPSTRTEKGGAEDNTESYDHEAKVWTIKVGDSAKSWAKVIGKLLTGKFPARKLVIDLSELRPAGKRLRGYGWLSSGWKPLEHALTRISKIMQRAAGRPLTALEIGDIVNFLGTILSSRRSAQIWLLDDTSGELPGFVDFKEGRYEQDDFGNTNEQREQSNNSIVFWTKPESEVLKNLLGRILRGGEPGFINGAEAKRRAADFQGSNPCAEILLPSKGFCNLVQVVWHRFNGDFEGLKRAQYIAGRANYRQTCVSMRDGVLQIGWNDNQSLLRLCGVAPLGYVSWEGLNNPDMLEQMRRAAVDGADSMADEFGTPHARRVTQVQPGGTSSKHLGLDGDEVHEGAHLALSRWIFNNINVSKDDPLADALRSANYEVTQHPYNPDAVLVKVPVEYPASPMFTKATMVIDGREEEVEVNCETAVEQLERYRILMNHYVDHNASITISFDETEIDDVTDWFMQHWDEYVGVSFLRRNDPTKTAKDLGFAYLPQEAVSKRMYEEYVSRLLPFNMNFDQGEELIDMGDCSTGACPIR